MFCTQCGAQLDQGDNFCRNCGARVGKATDPVSPNPVEESHIESRSGRSTNEHGRGFDAGHAANANLVSQGIPQAANTPMLIGLVVVLMIAAGAGVYFGTDLLRQPASQAPAPMEQALRTAPPMTADQVEEPKIASATSESNPVSTTEPPTTEPPPPGAMEVPTPPVELLPTPAAKADAPASLRRSQPHRRHRMLRSRPRDSAAFFVCIPTRW